MAALTAVAEVAVVDYFADQDTFVAAAPAVDVAVVDTEGVAVDAAAVVDVFDSILSSEQNYAQLSNVYKNIFICYSCNYLMESGLQI